MEKGKGARARVGYWERERTRTNADEDGDERGFCDVDDANAERGVLVISDRVSRARSTSRGLTRWMRTRVGSARSTKSLGTTSRRNEGWITAW